MEPTGTGKDEKALKGRTQEGWDKEQTLGQERERNRELNWRKERETGTITGLRIK